MPTQVDRLTKDSSPEAVKAAVSQCISVEVDGGKTPKQAAGMCYGMAREKTSKALKPKGR